MSNKINLKIITPEKIIFDNFVDIVIIKTIVGYMGVLYGHIPLVSAIVESEMFYKINNKKYKLNIFKGILKIEQEFIKIITEKVILIE